MYAQVLLISEA